MDQLPTGLPPTSPAARKGIARTIVTVPSDRELQLEQRIKQLEEQLAALSTVRLQAIAEREVYNRCFIVAMGALTTYQQGHDVFYNQATGDLQLIQHAHPAGSTPATCAACSWHQLSQTSLWYPLLKALRPLAAKCWHSFETLLATNRLGLLVSQVTTAYEAGLLTAASKEGHPPVTSMKQWWQNYVLHALSLRHVQPIDKPVLKALVLLISELK